MQTREEYRVNLLNAKAWFCLPKKLIPHKNPVNMYKQWVSVHIMSSNDCSIHLRHWMDAISGFCCYGNEFV